MRTASIFLAVCCWLSAAVGQWLETTIPVPDTFGGLSMPNCLAYDTIDNTVFVAGEYTERILVLDAPSGRRVGWVPFAGDIRSLCYNPVSNKVYAAAGDRDMVAVIDAATRQIVETLPVGSRPYALAFNATMNRVYCVNSSSDDVTVIDGEGDSVVATIDVGDRPEALCWNPTRNVVYSADYDDSTITVIDAAADIVIDTISVSGNPAAFLYNQDRNKLYVASRGEGLVVVDGLADTLLSIVAAGHWLFRLCYNQVNGKLYAMAEDDEFVRVVDCIADSLLGLIDCCASDAAFNVRDGRLYVVDEDAVFVADGATDSLLWVAWVGYNVNAVCVADSGRRVFRTADDECLVGVIDCAGDSLLALVGTDIHPQPSALCFNPTANKAYCAVEGTNEVMVIDGNDNTVRHVLPVDRGSKALLYNAVGNKVYCANSDDGFEPADLTVIDGSGDSIMRTIETGPEEVSARLCLNLAGDRLYEAVYGDKTVVVFDAVADTIVRRVPLPSGARAICYGPTYNYVYVAVSRAVDVIDAKQNVVIAEVDVGLRPTAICYVPVGAKVYTADRDGGTVSVIAGERPERVAQIDVGEHPCALAWASLYNKVYCADRDSSVLVIDVRTDTLVARVPVGRYPYALCYDSLNKRVYCACRNDSSIVVIDCFRDSVIAKIHVGAEPVALAWNPIESRTYVANYSGASISIIRDSLFVGVQETMYDERPSPSQQSPAVSPGCELLLSTVDLRLSD